MAGGAVHTRKTASMPSRYASRLSGTAEIAAHYLNLWRKISCVRVARQCADFRVPGVQLTDNFTADPTGGADDKDAIHKYDSTGGQIASE